MSNTARKIFYLLFPSSKKYGIYLRVIIENRYQKFFNKSKDQNFLFILSPPFCGSTLLNEIISTSRLVSVNNKYGTREGQKLPTVRKIMFDHENRWEDDHKYNWAFIKKEWLKYWDQSKPVLLEKSPPNIRHAKAISEHFDNLFFIIFFRNPYAHCESLMRRTQMDATSSAKFALNCLNIKRQIFKI